MAKSRKNGNGKRLVTQSSVNGAIKSICDIMRRSNCAGALQYVPELTWILFLRILDERETREAEQSEAGNHRIEMRYRPRSVLIGAVMTAAGLLGALLFWLLATRTSAS